MRRGFSLIELLVAMGIIGLLAGMMMPMYAVVRKSSMKSATEFTLKKVDTALRLFKTDWDVYPGQVSYPDLSGGAAFTNRLYYHLGSDLGDTHRQEILTDVATASAKFAYNATHGSEGAQPSTLTFTRALMTNEPRSSWNANYTTSYAALANRMAREQVRLAAVSGNLWLRGHIVSTGPNPANIVSNKSATAILPSPRASEAAPGSGWACDYLAGELEARYISGQAIIDGYGNPLVYICQLVPGIGGVGARMWEERVTIRDNKRYGMGPLGFDPSQGPGPGLVTTRPHLLFGGRMPLGGIDAGDNLGPTPADATYFPDTSRPLHSDIRFYAAPAFSREFELWSCGPDRAFDYMRDAAANQDNISAVRYTKGL